MTPSRYDRFFMREYGITYKSFYKKIFIKGRTRQMILRMGIPYDLELSQRIITKPNGRKTRMFRSLVIKWIILNRDIVVLKLL